MLCPSWRPLPLLGGSCLCPSPHRCLSAPAFLDYCPALPFLSLRVRVLIPRLSPGAPHHGLLVSSFPSDPAPLCPSSQLPVEGTKLGQSRESQSPAPCPAWGSVLSVSVSLSPSLPSSYPALSLTSALQASSTKCSCLYQTPSSALGTPTPARRGPLTASGSPCVLSLSFFFLYTSPHQPSTPARDHPTVLLLPGTAPALGPAS